MFILFLRCLITLDIHCIWWTPSTSRHLCMSGISLVDWYKVLLLFSRRRCCIASFLTLLHISGFSDFHRVVENGLCSLGRWVGCLHCDPVTLIPGYQTWGNVVGDMTLNLWNPNAFLCSVAVMHRDGMNWGSQDAYFVALCCWQWWPVNLCDVPLCLHLNLGFITAWACHSGEKWFCSTSSWICR